MKVKELIEKLSQYPEDAEIVWNKYDNKLYPYYFVGRIMLYGNNVHLSRR